jgi:hypothetical protein
MASLLSDQNMCNFYIWDTLWDKVYNNKPCTEGGVENIQDVAFSMSLAELCATDNMLGVMHVFGPQEMTSCTILNCGE